MDEHKLGIGYAGKVAEMVSRGYGLYLVGEVVDLGELKEHVEQIQSEGKPEPCAYVPTRIVANLDEQDAKDLGLESPYNNVANGPAYGLLIAPDPSAIMSLGSMESLVCLKPGDGKLKVVGIGFNPNVPDAKDEADILRQVIGPEYDLPLLKLI